MKRKPFSQSPVYIVLLIFQVAVFLIAGCRAGSGSPTAEVTPTATVVSHEPSPTANTGSTGGALTSTAVPSPSSIPSEATATPSPSPIPSEATATPSPAFSTPTSNPKVTGLTMPIKGAPLPTYEGQLPGAPRPYRNGVHQGIDFYYINAQGGPVTYDTEILSVERGRVIRADLDYVEATQAEMDEMLSESQKLGSTPPEVLDRLRGRQIWLDHGDGITTRYAHLNEIAPEIRIGTEVRQGQLLGLAGNSGTPEAARGLKVEVHLHLEIWANGRFLGDGLSVDEVRDLLRQAFSRGN